MLEPAPLILAFSAVVAVAAGRLLARRASLPVALLAATVGVLFAQAIGDGPLGGLLPLGGTAWPAPLVGAILLERLAARVATNWERGQQP